MTPEKQELSEANPNAWAEEKAAQLARFAGVYNRHGDMRSDDTRKAIAAALMEARNSVVWRHTCIHHTDAERVAVENKCPCCLWQRAEAAEVRVKKLEAAPLCDGHAEAWYCERSLFTTKTGCILCDFLALEARVKELEKQSTAASALLGECRAACVRLVAHNAALAKARETLSTASPNPA